MSQSSSYTSSSSSMARLFSKGSSSVHLEHMTDKTATVTGLWVCETPLSKTPNSGLTHDFLIVGLCDSCGVGSMIRAEKYNEGDRAGIRVELIDKIKEEVYSTLYGGKGLSVTIKTSELSKILTSIDPDYSLLRDNCWKYAFLAYKRLLVEFLRIQPADKVCILNLARKMQRPLLPADLSDAAIAGSIGGAMAAALVVVTGGPAAVGLFAVGALIPYIARVILRMD